MKYLKWLVILLLLVAVASSLYLLVPHKTKTPTGASLLPADTFLFLQMPDVAKSKQDFKTTALYQIWSEKEVQDFVGKAAEAMRTAYHEKVGDNPYASLLRRGTELARGEMFIALPELGAIQKEIPSMVMGVDVKERKAEANQWIDEVKAKLKAEVAKLAEESTTYKGVTYKRWTTPRTTISLAYFGSMLVVTSKPEAMEQIIDRIKDKAAPILEKDERYQNARKHMPSAYAALAYCNPKPLVAMLKGLVLFMPQLQSTMQGADAVQAISYSTTFTNGSFQDVVFVDAPVGTRGDMGAETAPTQRKTLPLTSASALVYSVQSMNMGKARDTLFQPLQSIPVPKLQELLFQLEKFNRDNGIDPNEFLNGIGPEYAFSLNWETNAPMPEMFVALEIRDMAKITASLDKLWQWGKTSATETGMDPFTDIAYNGVTIHAMQSPIVSPCYVVTEKFLLISLQSDTAKQLIDKQAGAGKSLADNPIYQKTISTLPSGGYSYSYLDTSNLFMRTYNFIRPLVARYGGAASAVQSYVDLNKMPQTQTIAKHLQPSAATQVADKDGFTTVIISPVGMPAVTVGAMIGAAVAIGAELGFPMK